MLANMQLTNIEAQAVLRKSALPNTYLCFSGLSPRLPSSFNAAWNIRSITRTQLAQGPQILRRPGKTLALAQLC